MRMSRITVPLIAAFGAQLVPLASADAQPPMYTLPKQDFVWNWGDVALEQRKQGLADIDISGTESFFRCDLTARMRAGNTLSQPEIRGIEQQLTTRIDFIYAVSEAMNYLEANRDLDWATLDCKKQEAAASSPEERAEREDEAREKMLRELERRRERQQRDSN